MTICWVGDGLKSLRGQMLLGVKVKEEPNRLTRMKGKYNLILSTVSLEKLKYLILKYVKLLMLLQTTD